MAAQQKPKINLPVKSFFSISPEKLRIAIIKLIAGIINLIEMFSTVVSLS